MAATDIDPDTRVTATINGVMTTTTAGEIAEINPHPQISVPRIGAKAESPNRSRRGHSKSSSDRNGGSILIQAHRIASVAIM